MVLKILDHFRFTILYGKFEQFLRLILCNYIAGSILAHTPIVA
jgi:hypothetical protein